ncbi:hypothetical protein SAMN05421810_108102 [Amycolatopsis arida]|uniref:Uncharacterized protein n=1 Tax=Amycolatopsis arida TaxID=587909 RepID=A0A1I5Z0J3_9PSEU|nr:hypothetical protein [Amycolatopsis arida]TDX90015.1 hypothetical protein CLV69_108102 [Amycolatopsis arida]SFQ49835.1 hypothetical protein SAMN05421810_108102 [Amycolatopsis arida]
MSADAKRLRSNLLEEIFWTRTGLLLLILVVVSGSTMWLASAMSTGLWRDFVYAIGTGTLVTAVVGFGQTLITASASQRALVEPLVEESKRALRELSAEYRALNSEFFPTHVFEASSEPDPAFNKQMMRDLHSTRQYFFRGFSGRHAAARLLLDHADRELRVIIADPRDGVTMTGRTRYLLRHEGAEADHESVRHKLRDDAWIGLVGLFLARTRCVRVDITAVTDPRIDRLEMFDDSVWLTLYSNARDASTLYPRTLRFSERSFVYGMERADFLRVCASRTERHFEITPNTTREEFLALFHKITGTAIDEERFRDFERRFHHFRQKFTHAAELGS